MPPALIITAECDPVRDGGEYHGQRLLEAGVPATISRYDSQQNFVVLRQMTLNLLKQEHTATCGIKARRLKAGWNEDYLRKVLAA